MIKVHHLEQSRSLRILWLLEELGLEYEFETYVRDPETMRSPPELAKVHPLKKSPMIEDDGKLITESGAIIDYLTQVKAGGKLAYGPESPHYADYQQWLHFAEGSVMGSMVYHLIAAASEVKNEALWAFIDGENEGNFKLMQDHLKDKQYLVANEFSAADVNISFPLEFAEPRGILKQYPGLQTYLARLQDRPAYQRTREIGGNYDLSMFAVGAA